MISGDNRDRARVLRDRIEQRVAIVDILGAQSRFIMKNVANDDRHERVIWRCRCAIGAQELAQTRESESKTIARGVANVDIREMNNGERGRCAWLGWYDGVRHRAV
ncbi:MAG: hypothetical protein M0R66_00385 [Candidatus Omnitrophica bacterium]|nr:hypothetical protein [Candidatus Omnitrophota bacterium]